LVPRILGFNTHRSKRSAEKLGLKQTRWNFGPSKGNPNQSHRADQRIAISEQTRLGKMNAAQDELLQAATWESEAQRSRPTFVSPLGGRRAQAHTGNKYFQDSQQEKKKSSTFEG